MQCERVVSFFFQGNDPEEIKENKVSMAKRYGNLGRHPSLQQYIAVDADTAGRITHEEIMVKVAELGANIRTGVYIYCHSGESTMVPTTDTAAQVVLTWLIGKDKTAENGIVNLNKLNLTSCLGAGTSSTRKKVVSSHLVALCSALKKVAGEHNVNLPEGLAVCGYTALMGTYDPQFTHQRISDPSRLSKEFSDPKVQGNRPIRTYMKPIGQTVSIPTHSRGTFSDIDEPIKALLREALDQVWKNKKTENGRKMKEFLQKFSEAERYEGILALGQNAPQAFLAFLDSFETDLEQAVVSILEKTTHTSAGFVSSIVGYCRSKVIMVHEKGNFRTGSISEYTDSAELAKMTDSAEIFVKKTDNPRMYKVVV